MKKTIEGTYRNIFDGSYHFVFHGTSCFGKQMHYILEYFLIPQGIRFLPFRYLARNTQTASAFGGILRCF